MYTRPIQNKRFNKSISNKIELKRLITNDTLTKIYLYIFLLPNILNSILYYTIILYNYWHVFKFEQN